MLASAWDAICRWATAVFGSWPNATQGSLSAAVGVGAALLVFSLTRRHERRLAVENEARKSVAGLLGALLTTVKQLAGAANPEETRDLVGRLLIVCVQTESTLRPASVAAADQLEDSTDKLFMQQHPENLSESELHELLRPIFRLARGYLGGKLAEPSDD